MRLVQTLQRNRQVKGTEQRPVRQAGEDTGQRAGRGSCTCGQDCLQRPLPPHETFEGLSSEQQETSARGEAAIMVMVSWTHSKKTTLGQLLLEPAVSA